MKEPLNIRLDAQVKTSLEELSQQAGLSMTEFVSSLIEQHPVHEQAQRDVEQLKGDVARLEAVANSLKVPRLEVLLEELRGKQVGSRIIESKGDLLAVLAESFRYQQQEGEITVSAEPVPVQDVRHEVPTPGPFSFRRAAFAVAALVVVMLSTAWAWRMVKK